MFQLTQQEMLALIDTKWEAEQNLKAIPKLILFVDWVIPDPDKEFWDRLRRFKNGRKMGRIQ